VRALVKSAPRPGIDYVTDRPEPELGLGDVRIEVAAASVCGTDRELYEYTPAAEAFALRFPVTMGHEVSGRVVEIGPGCRGLALGDPVALESHIACSSCYQCRNGRAHNCERMLLLGLHVDGGFTERMVVPESTCVRLPPEVSLESGALMESAGVAMHALQRSAVEVAGERVLIGGAGPIGLVLVQLARAMGAREVAVVEPNPFRRELAGRLGAEVLTPEDDVASWCRSRSGARHGFDVAFDCSGAAGSLDTLLQAVRKESVVVAVGLGRHPLSLDVTDTLIKRGITLRGSFGRSLWSTWERLAQLVDGGAVDLESMITHRLPLQDFAVAMDLLRGDSCKVLLVPDL